MHFTPAYMEMLEDKLREMELSGGVKPSDYNWYLVANELVTFHRSEVAKVELLKRARDQVSSAEAELAHLREKQIHLQGLFKGLNEERMAQLDAKQPGK